MENPNPIASTDEPDQEESGWTSYFEDFLATQRREDQQHDNTTSLSDESFCSPSLVSDAASCAPSRTENHNNQVPSCSPVPEDGLPISITPHKTGSFKKPTRTQEMSRDDSLEDTACSSANYSSKVICRDDPLEDTASSPANSPKVGSLKEKVMITKPRKREDNNGVEISCSLVVGKGGGSDCCTEIQIGGNETTVEGYTELNKRGLCLVPLSILLNYLH